MKVYEYNYDKNEAIEYEFGDIKNIESFEEELSQFLTYWSYDEAAAHELVEDRKSVYIKLDVFKKLKYTKTWMKTSKKYKYSIIDDLVKLDITVFDDDGAFDSFLNKNIIKQG